jgi:hypothetical protein
MLEKTITIAIKANSLVNQKAKKLCDLMMEEIGKLQPSEMITILRKRKNIRQHHITYKTGIPQSRQSYLENGGEVTPDEFIAIANVILGNEGQQ